MKLFKLEKSNCTPCKMADSNLKNHFGVELDKENKINLNQNPDIAMKLQVMQAPTFLLLSKDVSLEELKKMTKQEIDDITVTMYSGVGITKLGEILEDAGLLS
ncbi:thioredoxin family protein [Klebsiella pneumoniae]|nr:thioredoxin family protein [Klebsiella pneumoniae]MDS7714389.1 thioredoxin family protein [Klebsiella pneumoniae]UUV46263.1 thioredoxin [Bacillus phage vB_BanS-Thrax2]